MPPKPQVFKSPDGKEFTSKSEWRDYMMATFFSFKNKVNEAEPLVKTPGVVDGQMFDIADCENSTLVVMDHTEQVQVDQVKNSRIFLGACTSSIFIRNCENCVFYTCCRQLRLREVVNCKFYIYSMAEVHIEYSNGLQFAPFNGGYPEHAAHLKTANLDTKHNLWYDIYDHNDPGKTHANWSLLPESEYEEPWFPAGACEPAIPRTKPGTVTRPEVAENMQSFSLQQMMQDASKLPPKVASPVQPAAAPVAPAAGGPAPVAVVPPAVPVAESPAVDAGVLAVLKAFTSFSGSSDILDIVLEDSTVVLGDGNELAINDYSVILSTERGHLWNVGKVVVAEGGNSAVAVYWACNAAGSFASKHSASLVKTTNGWRIAHLHQSPAWPIEKVPAKNQV